MVMKVASVRSVVFFAMGVLMAGLVVSTTESVAQQQARGSRGKDQPVQRIRPRQEIYANLSTQLGLNDVEAAQELLSSVENRGFPLREAIVLLLLAKAGADRLIEAGDMPKDAALEALQSSADVLVDLVDNEAAGWQALAESTGAQVNLTQLVMTARAVMGLYSERAGESRIEPMVELGVTTKVEQGTPSERKPAPAEGKRPAPERKPMAQAAKPLAQAAKPVAPEGMGRRSNEPGSQPARTFPRETILKNLAKEFAVDEETANTLLTRLESKMPLREGVMLMVVANELTRRQILLGEITKAQRKEALTSNVDTLLPFREEGEGWGNVGPRVGLHISGRTLNQKSRMLIGQGMMGMQHQLQE